MASTHVKGNAHLSRFRDESCAFIFGTGDTPSRTLIASQGAKYQIYVKRIAVHVTTAAAQAWTFDSSSTSKVLASLPASATVGDTHVLLDAEEEGIPLPVGESLDLTGTAGVAGSLEVVAYQRVAPGAVLVPSQL